jgi:hypothetical protein
VWQTLTGAGGLVVADDRLLLIRQRRHFGIHWELPSGYQDRWWPDRTGRFHLHADVSVRDDGTQDYRFR